MECILLKIILYCTSYECIQYVNDGYFQKCQSLNVKACKKLTTEYDALV